MTALIEISDLKVHFHTEFGVVKALDGVSFNIDAGKTIGVVGESGCGKSVTAMAIMGLVQRPGKIVAGEIKYHRPDGVVTMHDMDPKGKKIRGIRGNEIAMIFQEPMTSLNPVFTVGYQIMESIVLHQKANRRQARNLAVEMLTKVGIPWPEQRVDEFPHQLSGGMRQRAMIAMALSCHPALLIADEPTTALDVTIQAQVLEVMAELREELGMAIVLITHDLGVIAGMADEVVVMYLGQVVEKADVMRIFHHHRHPYTQGLMASVPSITSSTFDIKPIEGIVPDPFDLPPGCRFEPRCSQAKDICKIESPPLVEIAPGHFVACFLDE